jgi:hypothetical protein
LVPVRWASSIPSDFISAPDPVHRLDSILALPPVLVSAPKHFSFPAPAHFVVTHRSCFEFSHGYVHLFVITATAILDASDQ